MEAGKGEPIVICGAATFGEGLISISLGLHYPFPAGLFLGKRGKGWAAAVKVKHTML